MVYFHDLWSFRCRPKCIEEIKKGLLPQKWMGKKIYPITQNGVLDVDYEYEIKIAEDWLNQMDLLKKNYLKF